MFEMKTNLLSFVFVCLKYLCFFLVFLLILASRRSLFDAFAKMCHSQLQQSIEDNEGSILSSRLERQTRDMNQQIRQQQDQDYLESLRADQEKERKRRMERERQEREEQDLRRRKQKEEDEEEQLKQLRQTLAEKLAPEPKSNGPQTIRLRVQFPNGRKVQRLFERDQSIKYLFEFVFTQSDCPKRFKLQTNFPLRELPSTYPTVHDPECRSTTDSKSEPITFAQFGIVKDEIVYLFDLDAWTFFSCNFCCTTNDLTHSFNKGRIRTPSS